MNLCNLVLTAALTLNPATPMVPADQKMAAVLGSVFVSPNASPEKANWEPSEVLVGEIPTEELLSRYPSLLTASPDPKEGLAFIEDFREILDDVDGGLWRSSENLPRLVSGLLMGLLGVAGVIAVWRFPYRKGGLVLVSSIGGVSGALILGAHFNLSTYDELVSHQRAGLEGNREWFEHHVARHAEEWWWDLNPGAVRVWRIGAPPPWGPRD